MPSAATIPAPRPKSHVLACVLAAVAISAVALTRSSRATAEVAGLSASILDDADDALYECTMGKPAVATAYENGSWGTIEGDWYVVAGKYKHSSDAAGDCCRMKFQMPNSKTHNQVCSVCFGMLGVFLALTLTNYPPSSSWPPLCARCASVCSVCFKP